MVEAHDQAVTNHYTIHYPEHFPREDDPNYKDFNAYHRRTKNDPEIYKCAIGKHRNDYSDCDLTKPLELHHSHIEFSMQNGVELTWLEVDYPGVSNAEEVGAWVETAANLEWLCIKCHRGAGGIHHASAADFEAEKYVRGLIS